MKAVCDRLAMSRQNYYKRRQHRQRQHLQQDKVLDFVIQERSVQPKLGGRKLLGMMREDPAMEAVELGRDRFFKLLKENDLLVEYEPVSKRTTQSYHTLPVFTNRFKAGVEISGPNQAWLSDLTYIRLLHGFAFLFLISDKFSRKIIGYHLSQSMETADALAALEMAVDQLPPRQHPIHHSDRGCQYCSHQYIDRILAEGIEVSMTEENHCYENAQAERLNGILKQEYGLGGKIPTLAQAQLLVDQAVNLYNHRRPHWSLDLKCPTQVHDRAAPRGADPLPSLN